MFSKNSILSSFLAKFRSDQTKKFWIIYSTVERRFNELLYNEVLGIINDIHQLSNSKVYGQNLNKIKLRYNAHILPDPWPFIISRFRCRYYSRDMFSCLSSFQIINKWNKTDITDNKGWKTNTQDNLAGFWLSDIGTISDLKAVTYFKI